MELKRLCFGLYETKAHYKLMLSVTMFHFIPGFSFKGNQFQHLNQKWKKGDFSVSAANSQEISIYFNKYLFGRNKYFLAYFWEENKYILA